MTPRKHINKLHFSQSTLDDDGITHWMIWNRTGWEQINESWDKGVWAQRDWDYTIITRIIEFQAFILKDSRFLMDYNLNVLTVSHQVLLVLESHPSLRTLGGLFTIHLDHNQSPDRLYLGTEEDRRIGCLKIDNVDGTN